MIKTYLAKWFLAPLKVAGVHTVTCGGIISASIEKILFTAHEFGRFILLSKFADYLILSDELVADSVRFLLGNCS